MTLFSALAKRPLRSLAFCFAVWKTILYLAILVSPGPGYDTSTLLLGAFQTPIQGSRTVQNRPEEPAWGIYKLVRWDALYFTDIARRGRPFEQEWAFGYGYTKLLSWFTAGLTISGLTSSLLPEALAGALLASTCHFLSVAVLYQLSQLVFSTRSTVRNQNLSFAVAVLHIINPAGAFLAAPYSEAVFSLLNFTGFYAFLSGVGPSHQPLIQDLKVLLAGILFGLATTVRSNGILSGVLFAYAAIDAGLQTLSNGISGRAIQRLLFLVLGGSLIALGAAYPQYVAYSEYCRVASEDVQLRPWCNARLPSIYSWVQSHYWKAGFFRYWTISNLPLFALAAPMLLILSWSSLWAWKQLSPPTTDGASYPNTDGKLANGKAEQIFNPTSRSFVMCVSLIQAALGFTTLTTAHVQIITRLASGYPLWYWWLGTALLEKSNSQRWSRGAEWTVKWMVIYGSVQAGLFASFLPPA